MSTDSPNIPQHIQTLVETDKHLIAARKRKVEIKMQDWPSRRSLGGWQDEIKHRPTLLQDGEEVEGVSRLTEVESSLDSSLIF